ncbi:MAG: hypothetical protein HQ570_04050 [Candidatus Omnitrophica bacterium]|nr:hypothetical protein [Candidatus Omnitrophota bacterium]
MKKGIFFFLILLILPISSFAQEKVTATLFYSTHCKICHEVREEFLPQIEEKYKESLDWQRFNTAEDTDSLKLLISLTEQFNLKEALIPSILIGDTLLVGKDKIKDNLEIAIKVALETEKSPLSFLKTDVLDFFKKFSVLTVIGNGLIDGINPCAFAVIVFFISFLGVYGYRKAEIIYVGVFYCLAVFITYLLIGLGFFNFFYSLERVYLVIKVFYYFVAFFCFSMAIVALYDYYKFKKTGYSEEAILQLPKFLKKRINLVIGSRMREKKGGIWGLCISSFVVGFLVSLLEAVCTGQVYLPTIVFILKNTDLKLKAAAYLFLYNFMFVLPLIVIFLLSLAGVSSIKFTNFLKKNLGRIKILMAIVFFCLGLFILVLS